MSVAMTERDRLLADIARKHLFVPTLETRNIEDADFHDCAVWTIKAALEDAYEAGRRAAGAAHEGASA